jgi:phosphoribosylformylglycinamidine cyclo-ligase
VGVVEKSAIIDGSLIAPGDRIIGLASSGPHSNGFSLIRKIVTDSGADMNQAFDSTTLGLRLLTPTRIYVKSLLQLIESNSVNAIAHITGGGIPENLVRVLHEGIDARVNTSSWQRPAIFDWLQTQGNVAESEMLRTFNCGIGMMVVVPEDQAAAAIESLNAAGETAMEIGVIESGSGQVHTHT